MIRSCCTILEGTYRAHGKGQLSSQPSSRRGYIDAPSPRAQIWVCLRRLEFIEKMLISLPMHGVYLSATWPKVATS